MRTTDVLVIGLGPAGSAAAAAAAARGLKVIAIDRKKVIGEPVQCAEFIPLPLARHARRTGVLLQRIAGMNSVLPSGAVTASPFPGLMVDRAAFDRALACEAQQAGAELMLASALRSVDRQAGAARVATPAGSVSIRYRVMVAADGPHSGVARELGLKPIASVNTRQYTVALTHPYHATDIWLADEYPGGYAWLFPKGAHANLGLGVDPCFERDLKTPLDALHRHLVAAGRVGAKIFHRTGGAIPVGGLRERLAVGNVLFVGDAAGLTHPITGAGIAAAVISGERAGQAAAGYLGGHDAAALREFEDDLRDQFEATLARAVTRRNELNGYWHTAAAQQDQPHRRGWIAFPEYFAEPQPVRFYRPDYRVRTPAMRSPEYVQMSTAAAITLGLVAGKMHRTACTHCLNLLVTYPEGCRANCAYCGLARHREEARDYADRNFIRVDWPAARYDDVIARVQAGADRGQFQRMCISMITHPNSNDDTLVLLEKWVRAVPQVPVSILSNPTTLVRDDLVRMQRMGADIFTVALDAVMPEIFERTRGKGVDSPHKFEHYRRAIEWAAEVFGPEKFGAHLIGGLGETEREILEVAQQVRDLGGHNHMFAFYPEHGSLMEDWPPVDRGQWRRVQLARFIIDYAGGHIRDMAFDAEGRVIDFGVPELKLTEIINSGKPFRTSGCPGKDDDISACNRPYGDSGPTDVLSFPFALARRDVAKVKRQLCGHDIKAGM